MCSLASPRPSPRYLSDFVSNKPIQETNVMGESTLQAGDAQRMERALCSLAGLSVGDAFGERFFVAPAVVDGLIAQRALPAPPWNYTDDTMMAISIVETLQRFGSIDPDRLAASFAEKYDPSRGYGPAMRQLLRQIRAGEPLLALFPEH